MEVVNNCSAYLSNSEVLHLLQNTKSYKKQKMNQLATITYQTIKYLEDTPCKKQTPEKIRKFLKAIEPFELSKSEKLIILNLCPKRPIEIDRIVEDSEDRLSEAQVETLLQIIANLQEDKEPDAEQT